MPSSLKPLEQFYQISLGAFCGKDIDNLFERFRTIEQDGRYTQYMVKTLKNLLLQNQDSFEAECWYIALGTHGLTFCSNNDRRLDFFYGEVKFPPPYICMGKMLKNHFLEMY